MDKRTAELEENRYFGIFVYRTVSKEDGLKTKKMVGPLKSSWSEVLGSMLQMFPADRLEQMNNEVIIGMPPPTLLSYTSDAKLDSQQVDRLQHNLLRDKDGDPILELGAYKIIYTRVYTVMIDAPRESSGETTETVGLQLLAGSRDCDMLEVVRVHESSAQEVRNHMLTGKLED